mmetsp:Transcript_9871/g.27543  ORF Transcript_9871/g.27543 Transcript_9871/m.27543 type:complete len:162 (-) Transcript_9871:121-606(-)
MTSTIIELTEGMAEWMSRLSLKKTMERFGEVVGCHMGQRGQDRPIVRFQTRTQAESALEALKAGQVYLEGFMISGEWQEVIAKNKDGGSRNESQRGRRDEPPPPAMEMTSRDFLPGLNRRARSRRTSRSRSRRRVRRRSSRSGSRSRSRSRSRRRSRPRRR